MESVNTINKSSLPTPNPLQQNRNQKTSCNVHGKLCTADFFYIKSRFRSTSNYKWLLGKSYKTMEYIKVSRVTVRVRNSLVARCPRQAEPFLVASLQGRPQKTPGHKQHGQVEGLNLIPWFIVSQFHVQFQKDSSFTADISPFGVEEREEPLSVLSDPELLWFCCSDPALEVTVEEDVEEERVFSLKSVIMTVTLPTVTANCCAVLLSTFFSRGLKHAKEAT